MSDKFLVQNPLAAGVNEIRSQWGRFTALGIVFMTLGLFCIFYSGIATAATVLVLGWMLLFSGIVSLIQSFWVRNWNGFFLFFLNALLRGVLGYLLLRHPLAGAAGVTLVLGSLFVVGGLFRIVGASVLRFPSWGWAVLSGIVSLVLGVVVLAHMPVMSVFFLGIVVGVDLLTDGIAFVALGTQLHSIPKIEPYKASKAA
jgi:uncharacterized membrane protein HdeD (DUF308 family)